MAGVIYCYTWLVPIILWAVLSWQGLAVASILETIAIYGYSVTIYIPICVSEAIPHCSHMIPSSTLIGIMANTHPMVTMVVSSSGCGHVR